MELGPWHVAARRYVGPYDGVGQAWQQLFASPHLQVQLEPDMEYFAAYYDDPLGDGPGDYRMDACMTVSAGFSGGDGIEVRDITGGQWAVLRHIGSYRNLGASYRLLLYAWLPGSGRQLDARRPCLEIYRNSPLTVSEAELITEVCVPLI